MTVRTRAAWLLPICAVLAISAATTGPALAATTPPAPSPSPSPSAVELLNPSGELIAARDRVTALAAAAESAALENAKAAKDAAAARDLADEARAEADEATVTADAARAALGTYAASAYINGGTSATLAATLDAESPSDLLSRQNTLDAVAANSADLVRVLRAAQAGADAATRRADAALRSARAAEERATLAASAAKAALSEAETLVAAMTAAEAAAQTEAMLRARAAALAASPGAPVTGDRVPVEYLVYGNGRIPAEALSEVSGTGGHRLWPPAARSLESLLAAAQADGITIGVTDSYRPYEVQVDLVARKGLYSQGGLAATPGTSDHGWGIATDLALSAQALEWMRSHAAAFGYVEDVPRETWHWAYYPTGE